MKKFLSKFSLTEDFYKNSTFIVINALILYILYLGINNLDNFIRHVGSAVDGFINALYPLWIGILLAFILYPIVKKIENLLSPYFKSKKLPKYLGIFTSLLAFIAIISLIIYGLTSLILGQLTFSNLSSNLGKVTEIFTKYKLALEEWGKSSEYANVISSQIVSVSTSALNWLTSIFSTSLFEGLKKVGISLFNVIIGMIMCIYILIDHTYFTRKIKRVARLIVRNKQRRSTLSNLMNDIVNILALFVRGVLLDALIIAVLSSILLTVLGIKFSVFLGIFAGVMNIIPYFGPFAGMVPVFILTSITSSPLHGAVAVIAMIVLQQFDANLIYPKIVGEKLGLHPLIVILSVTVGWYYGGLLAMIIAAPVATIIIKILRAFIVKLENTKKQPS